MYRNFAIIGFHLDQSIAERRTKKISDPRPPGIGGRKIVDAAALVGRGRTVRERKGHTRMGQRRPHEGIRGMGPFGLGGAKEGPSRRHVAEELMDLDRRADSAPVGHHLADVAAVDRDRGPRAVGDAGANHEPGHLADACQRLASEAERADPLQILGHAELARGMRRHRQRQIGGLDAATVVNHPHQPDPTLLERDVDPGGGCVERVLEKLLDHARRPLHHLAGGNAIDDRHRKLMDASHACQRLSRAGIP